MKQINWFVGQWRFVFNKIDASVQCNGRWFDFFSGFKVCAWCERRFELHTIWARMNVYESVQMCIYERVGVPGWPVSRTQQLCYRYPPSTESTPLMVNHLIWSELLALYDCLTQHWRVVLVTMLASTGLTVKQRVTLRRNGRDVEVLSFISPCDLTRDAPGGGKNLGAGRGNS